MGYSFTARDQRDRMYLSLSHWRQTDTKSATWSDGVNFSLEEQLPEIATQILFTAEESFREWKVRQREYLIERKAELLERERRRKLENERRRLEHEAKLQQQRINHLLGQATALHRAVQIRSYVAAVTEANGTSPNPMSTDELLDWSKWALAQADRIDPIISGRFRDRPKEMEPPSDLEASDEDDYWSQFTKNRCDSGPLIPANFPDTRENGYSDYVLRHSFPLRPRVAFCRGSHGGSGTPHFDSRRIGVDDIELGRSRATETLDGVERESAEIGKAPPLIDTYRCRSKISCCAAVPLNRLSSRQGWRRTT